MPLKLRLRLRGRALDPLLSRDDVHVARRESDEAIFSSDRLTEASKRLRERLSEVNALETARAQDAEHKRVSAERDRLAAELERMAESISQLARLVVEAEACDRQIRRLSPKSGKRLGYVRPVLAGASPVVAMLLGDEVVWDAFSAVARSQSLPVERKSKAA